MNTISSWLLAQVIKSYQVPFDANFTRGFPQHLSPQITHLRRARPLSVSMANAIRYVKYEVSLINSDVLREDEVSPSSALANGHCELTSPSHRPRRRSLARLMRSCVTVSSWLVE